jgi:hypothetical protein
MGASSFPFSQHVNPEPLLPEEAEFHHAEVLKSLMSTGFLWSTCVTVMCTFAGMPAMRWLRMAFILQ